MKTRIDPNKLSPQNRMLYELNPIFVADEILDAARVPVPEKAPAQSTDRSKPNFVFPIEPAVAEVQRVVDAGGPYGPYKDIAEDWLFDFWPSYLPWVPSETPDVVDRIIAGHKDLLEQFKAVTGFDLEANLLEGKAEAAEMDDRDFSAHDQNGRGGRVV